MRDGTYSVHFRTNRDFGSGVVVAQSGQVRGGDQSYFYRGTFSQQGQNIVAQLRVEKHTNASASVFGNVNAFDLVLQGQDNGSVAVLQGASPQAPGQAFTAELRFLAA